MTRPYETTGDDHVIAGGVKLYIDGSGGARTAWLYASFVRGRTSYTALERWQISYLPVYPAWAAFVDDCRLKREFTPVFNVDAPRCKDGVGEGLLTALRPVK